MAKKKLKKFHRDRLERLCQLLDIVPDEHFDLTGWHNVNDDTSYDFNCLTRCGTTACACGWAMIIPEFNLAGFVKTPNYDMPYYNGKTGSEAVEAFFGLSDKDNIPSKEYYLWDSNVNRMTNLFTYFFVASSYPNRENTTAKEVAKRIRKWLKDN